MNDDKLNFRTAHAYAKRFKALKLWPVVRVQSPPIGSGYEVKLSQKDGSYEIIVRYEETAKDMLRIHAPD